VFVVLPKQIEDRNAGLPGAVERAVRADRRDKPFKRLIETLIEQRGTGSPRQIPGWR
jgi:hypothetical protein